MRTPLRLGAAVVAVLLLASCSSSKKSVRARAGHPAETTTSATETPPTSQGGVPDSTVTTAQAPKPTTTTPTSPAAAPVNVGALPETTPIGPPPPSSSGRGAITGHVYQDCSTPNSGASCQSQAGLPGDTISVKSGDALVASTQTARDGSYRVEVPAGLYTVQEGRYGYSTRVQVEAGKTVVADF